MSQAEPTGPLYAATLSDPRLGATTVKATAGCCPPSQLRPLEVEWARGVLASGMPVGIPPCGVRRRHLFGCKCAVSVLSGPDARGCVTISAHPYGARPARGCQSETLCPRVRRHCPFGKRIICDGTGLKLALGLSIAQAFLPVSRSCLPWVSQPYTRDAYIRSVRHRGLRRLIEDDNPRFIEQGLVDRVRKVLTVLILAERMDSFIAAAPPGWRIHRLSGNRQDEWSVSVSVNWRMTFREEDGYVSRLNLEDYH